MRQSRRTRYLLMAPGDGIPPHCQTSLHLFTTIIYLLKGYFSVQFSIQVMPIQSFLFYFRWCFHFKYRYEMPIVFTPLLLRCSSVELNSARRWFCSVSSNSEQLRQLIRTHTEVTRDHMTPEIQLHLITPRCSLWSAKGDDAPFTDPFWAFYWPGGQVLSRYKWLSMFV